MSDVLEVVRAQRPDRPSLDAATRNQIRARLAGQLDPNTPTESKPDFTINLGRSVGHERDPRRLMAVAAGVLTIAGIVGVWAGTNRPDEQPPPLAQQPSAEPSSESTLPAEGVVSVPGGAMILDQFPAVLADATGYSYVGTAEAPDGVLPESVSIQRWYTATMDQPELQPRLKLASTPATQPFPPKDQPVGADQVTVRGAAGWLYGDATSSGRTVAFQADETLFVLTGYQLSDDELLTAANNTTLAGSSVGAVIEPDALPVGLVERAVGTTAEDPFAPLESLQHPPASVRWYNPRLDGAPPGDDDPMLWLGWRVENPDLIALERLDYDNITNATVHDLPAFTATNDASTYLGVFWSEDGYTYTLGGFGLDPETVLEAANQLRPATDADWSVLEPEPG